jgi:hypothetical protein
MGIGGDSRETGDDARLEGFALRGEGRDLISGHVDHVDRSELICVAGTGVGLRDVDLEFVGYDFIRCERIRQYSVSMHNRVSIQEIPTTFEMRSGMRAKI